MTRNKGSNGGMMQVDLYGFQLIGDLPPSEDTGELILLTVSLYVKFLIISFAPINNSQHDG